MMANLKHKLLNLKPGTQADFKRLPVNIHPVLLTFSNSEYEAAFNTQYTDWITTRVRIGCVFVLIALFIDVLVGVLNPGQPYLAWVFRFGMIALCIIAFMVSFSAFFRAWYSILLPALIILSGLAQSAVVINDSTEDAMAYFGIIFTAPLACCILGLKFVSSVITISLMLMMFTILIALDELRSVHLLAYISVYLVYLIFASSINYLLEHSMRREFVYQQMLDSDRKKYAQMAQKDSLTNVSNRFGLTRLLTQRVNLSTDTSSIPRAIGLLLFIDLNDFKQINDDHGHIVGDEVLKTVARRLTDASYNANNIIARLGGDEFVVFLDGISSTKDIDYWQEHLSMIISQPMHVTRLDADLSSLDISITASLGHSLVHNTAHSIEHILEQADQRMYEQKKQT